LRLKALEDLNREVRKDAAKLAKSEFGYPGQVLRRLNCHVVWRGRKKTKAHWKLGLRTTKGDVASYASKEESQILEN
jgi:hypothetical protein